MIAPAKNHEPPVSKEAINRAGRLIASLLVVFREGDGEKIARLEAEQTGEIDAAFEVIDWWRSLHAKPLTSVSANLRHYVKPHGPILITQRLKRLPTVIDKLLREPNMKLSQMADIGGCRALLPDQASVYEVAKRLRKNWDVKRIRDYAAEPKSSGYRLLRTYRAAQPFLTTGIGEKR